MKSCRAIFVAALSVACFAGAADCATAGESDAAATLAESSSRESKTADVSGLPWPAVSNE